MFDYASDDLGINPLQTLIQKSGTWSLIFLCITLGLAPLFGALKAFSDYRINKLGKGGVDVGWLIGVRPMLGLYTYFYAALHFIIYLHFDVDWDWDWFLVEVYEKLYLQMGLLSLLILSLLAISTPRFIKEFLAHHWFTIHNFIYIGVVLAMGHFWLAVKVGDTRPWIFAAIVAVILIYREIRHFKSKNEVSA